MDEEGLGDIGFMFDRAHEKETARIDLSNDRVILLRTIGDTPGHKQSGQYLWPASKAAANYFIDNWASLSIDALQILELGAGCGLAGLSLATLVSNPETELIWTDYDYGTLSLIEESIELNSDQIASRKCYTEFLEWGNTSKFSDSSCLNGAKFLFIVGADLIYSKDIILPLFTTVKYFLKPDEEGKRSKFILFSSFHLEKVTYRLLSFL